MVISGQGLVAMGAVLSSVPGITNIVNTAKTWDKKFELLIERFKFISQMEPQIEKAENKKFHIYNPEYTLCLTFQAHDEWPWEANNWQYILWKRISGSQGGNGKVLWRKTKVKGSLHTENVIWLLGSKYVNLSLEERKNQERFL